MELDRLGVAQTASTVVAEPPDAAPPAGAAAPAPAAPPTTSFLDVLKRVSPWEAAVVALLALLFFPTFRSLYDTVWSKSDAPQSYGMLILPASLALAWMLRARLAGVTVRPSPLGLLPVALALFLLALGTRFEYATLSSLGFVFAVTGVIWHMYGWAVFRRLWFPVAFLLTMVKVPAVLINEATFQLQTISIKGAVLLLTPLYDVRVDGTQVHLGGYTLNVIAPCSGMTILLPIVVLAFYYLYLIAAPLWKKAILMACTVPVSLAVNALRVALIGVVGEAYGGKAAEAFHDYSGIFSVLLGFAALILIAQEIKCNAIHDDISL